MYIRKRKKILLPLFVFLIGMGILGGVMYGIREEQRRQNRTTANLNAMTYAERMKSEVMEGISVTDTLEQILISEDGQVAKFYRIAKDLLTDSLQSIQLAPDGIVSDIYPVEGNEAGKIDLLNDESRGEISRYARDHRVLVMQGPFELNQGGYGIAVRKPVYLKDEDAMDQATFWGFVIVIIRVPDIFEDSVNALSDFGYYYRLSKTVAPWDTTYEEVYSCGASELEEPVSYEFEMGGARWKLEVMPQSGWFAGDSYDILFGGTLIVLLLTILTAALLVLNENQKRFKRLAATDALTGLYNRHGFDHQVTQYLRKHPKTNCIGIQFDIDDFKLINDQYGHATGDLALQALAESMRQFFPKKAILGRNGGDEFCIFLPNCTCEQEANTIEKFTRMTRTFPYGEEEHTFSISLGYAQFPKYAKDYAQLMHCADAALYEIKLRGKHGCMAYKEGLRCEIRTQLGFALKDVSENLPGAFIIYKADGEADEILFANRELIRMTGCESMDELLAYTERQFHNLIREDERQMVTDSIWKQIEANNCDNNDYVYFHLKKKDGSFLQVLDHGRIVESGRYGRVFYVLLLDWKLIKKHYENSF